MNTPTTSFTEANEILTFLSQNGTINIHSVADEMRKVKKEKIIQEKHSFAITKAKDGRWKTYVADNTKKTGRRLIAKTSQEDLYDALIEYYDLQDAKQIVKETTLNDLYPKWLEYKRLHTNANSYINRIQRDWKAYYENTEIVNMLIVDFTRIYLDEWAHKLIKQYDMTSKQYYNATIILRQSLDYAVQIGLIDVNPFASVKIDGRRLFRHIKKQESKTQVFSNKERTQIESLAWADIKNSRGNRVHKLAPLAVLFQFHTGVRIGEVLSIKHDDITEDGQWIHIQRFYRYEDGSIAEHTKGAEGDRFVPLDSTAKHIISVAKQKQVELGISTEYIFSINSNPLPYYAVKYVYEHYCKEIGTVYKSSHKARKTYISTLIDSGVNINSIREYAGHTDEQTTLRNYCFDRSSETEKLKQIEDALVLQKVYS